MAPEPNSDKTKIIEPPPASRSALDSLRMHLGRDLVALGFLLVLGVFVIAIAFFASATDVATAVGPVTTLVGTLVGTIFGAQVAGQAQEKQSAAVNESAKRAQIAAALVPSESAPYLFQQWDSGPGNPAEGDF